MQKNYLELALKTAREMIQSYYVYRDFEGVSKHLSAENFTFFGFVKDYFYNSKEEFCKYASKALEYMLPYELIDENYSIGSQSRDSCIIIAKITIIDTRTQNILVLKYVFYFIEQDDAIICPHYHVMYLMNLDKAARSVFFNENIPYPKLFSEIISYNEDLIKFMSSDAVAEKSFYYDEEFPYRLVNQKYIKLLGYKTIREFITEQNNSSLVNIHAADRAAYVEYLKNHYENNVSWRDLEEKYQYRSTYYVSYRIKSPYLADEVHILEWGNFFTEKGRTIVNCFVLNLDEAEKISANQKFRASVREDCGIYIKQNVIIYPRSHRIKIDNEITELTPFEGEIFLILLDNLNQPVMPEEIYETLYKNSSLRVTSNVLPMHISNIRRKLSLYKDLIQLIFVKDRGYCLRI